MRIPDINGESTYSIFYDQELGFGSFGTVYRAKENKTGKDLAIKVLSKVKSTFRCISVEMNDDYL